MIHTGMTLGMLFAALSMLPGEPSPPLAFALSAPSAAPSPHDLQRACQDLAHQKIPYHFGGTSTSGMDCSASIQALFRRLGIHLARTSEAQANALAQQARLWRVDHRESEEDVFPRLTPGELLFWVNEDSPDRVSHVMLFLGMDGRRAHLWGARGSGKTGLTGSGVDFYHYSPGGRKRSRLVAHGRPSR